MKQKLNQNILKFQKIYIYKKRNQKHVALHRDTNGIYF